MPDITVDLPEDVYVQFEQLTDEEFLTQQEAVEELLSAGIEAYGVGGSDDPDLSEEYAEEMWDNVESTGDRDFDEGSGGSRSF